MNLQYVEFDPDERKLYKAVESHAKASINKYLEEDDVMKNYSTILAMVVRLRQVNQVSFSADRSYVFIHI
jgi:SWI/SNF-related matrix-associated actin-dependent regulator of chromatin subfamily A3